MKVAIVGGGLFGCTTAIHLARLGHDVHVFEASSDILGGATRVNQFRLHQGYHYPRSLETALECQRGLESFRGEYGFAVRPAGRQFYAVAHEGSRVNAGDYIRFCEKAGLPVVKADWSEDFNWDAIDLLLEVGEESFDLPAAKVYIKMQFADLGVKLHTKTAANKTLRDFFDRVVIAAYAHTNIVADELSVTRRGLQYEVVVKPVIGLPPEYADWGCVVMDGPFCSLDPWPGHKGYHLMGHVDLAIAHSNTGMYPEVPEIYLNGVYNGSVIEGIPVVDRMIDAAGEFWPFLRTKDVQKVGSMVTVRAVLPGRDEDDARPTLVEELDDQVVRIFSGKLGTAVDAASQVGELLKEQGNLMAV